MSQKKELNFAGYCSTLTMYYIIVLQLINFSRFLEEVGSVRLATVSGCFASFKFQHDNCFPRQLPPLFQIDCLLTRFKVSFLVLVVV